MCRILKLPIAQWGEEETPELFKALKHPERDGKLNEQMGKYQRCLQEAGR